MIIAAFANGLLANGLFANGLLVDAIRLIFGL